MFLYTKGKNHKYYHDDDFVPMFDSPNSNLPPSLSATRIAEVCAGNRFCIYDVQSTGILLLGQATKKAYEDYQQAKLALQKGKDKQMHNCSMVPPAPHYQNISFELVPHALKGVYYRSSQLTHFLPPPAMPLSCLCQTPRVINPSVIRTTAVVLRSSIIHCSLMALSCHSWSTNTWFVSASGLMCLSPSPHVNGRSEDLSNHSRNWGINCPNERSASCPHSNA